MPNITTNLQFLTTSEVAQILRLTTSHVRAMCEQGKLPARRTWGTSGQWRIDRLRFLELFNQGSDAAGCANAELPQLPQLPRQPELKIIEKPAVFDRIRNRVKNAKR